MADPEGIYNWDRLDGRITTSGQPAEAGAGDGAKNGLPAPNKELAKTKIPLDTKSPIQVRISFAPPASLSNAAIRP
jgi:hypothetical protein